MQRYNPKEIEPKWQKVWEETKIYQANDSSDKPKRFILEFFPYPSGAAMHVGHVRNYAIGDVMSRFSRMQGNEVLHPMGWDSFGLPAENFAIKNGVSPRVAIDQNTSRFKQQLTQMGFGYDWSREIDSSDPAYYRWTQEFFLLLLKKGLAYQQESLQWWCPVDKTVLANEQVESGHCWRCGSEVEKKSLKQWFFKITDYADRLEKDLDDVDWTDSIKNMQRNWIGRSQGAEIIFDIADSSHKLTVFTTRADTLFGATFMVLAPEHPLVPEITTVDHSQQVENYQQKTRNKSEVERQETNREKTGVFTGAYALNPLTGNRIPIWIADYVLAGYGTGAIMAVPAHDERDQAFAKQFDLPIVPVVSPAFFDYNPDAVDRNVAAVVTYDPKRDKYCVLDWYSGTRENAGYDFPGGGIEEGESVEDAAKREFAEETSYIDITIEKVLPATVSFYYRNDGGKPVRGVKQIVLARLNSDQRDESIVGDDYEKDAYDVVWATKDEILAHKKDEMNEAIADVVFNQVIQVGEGVMINSGSYNNLSTSDAREKIVADLAAKGVGEFRTNYKMRDWLISRQRYWGAPIPIIHCPKDGVVGVPVDQLPVVLPELSSFEPAGDGRSPLARVPEFVNTTCPTCGGSATRETDTMDGFACSSWYFLRYADPHNATKPFEKAKVAQWLPVDEYIGGAEHAVMHLLYARFWTKVMQDEGLIDFGEPFTSLRNHGMILAPDGQKMSKSKGNTIQPGDLIDQGYGADAIRIMELFIGPWNQSANWSVEGMGGSFRFLQRIWTLAQEFLTIEARENTADTANLNRITHRTIKKVSEDLETMSFNTAIAAMMEAVNDLYKEKIKTPYSEASDAWHEALCSLLQLLASFAPHIAEELWHQMGNESTIHLSSWPAYNEQYLTANTITIVVQVNGKLRAQIEVATDATQEVIIEQVMVHDKVVQAVDGKAIKKTIFIPGKLVNLVV